MYVKQQVKSSRVESSGFDDATWSRDVERGVLEGHQIKRMPNTDCDAPSGLDRVVSLCDTVRVTFQSLVGIGYVCY